MFYFKKLFHNFGKRMQIYDPEERFLQMSGRLLI